MLALSQIKPDTCRNVATKNFTFFAQRNLHGSTLHVVSALMTVSESYNSDNGIKIKYL
jgi:hypothetical protein